jgi:Tfp pilus assembly protein PilF
LIESWDDREITGGMEWAGKIDERLNAADLVILLVSPDFLASSYCYDIEMQRALERHDKREARVVPIILRPCDWKTSLFAKLNALPRDGKPVVDWPSPDHAFLNVAQGLRAVARELRDPAFETPPVIGRWTPARSTRRRVFVSISVVALVLLGLAVWFFFYEHQRNEQVSAYVARGNDLMNVGRYEEARKPFQDALSREPANRQAKLGIGIADLVASRSNAVAYQQRLTEMLNRWPNESHLRALNGDNLLARGDPQKAAREYSQAIKLNPRNAEAYFRLGVIYDKEGKLGHALAAYQKAVEISPYSAQYRDNLADAYFKHGDYEKAISEYGHLDRFPLAALESGNINRLLGRLDEAREQELTAIGWLGEKSIASLPENQLPWYFTHNTEGVSIASPGEKLCYARFEVAATLSLQGDASGAADNTKQALQACGFRSIHVKMAVRWDLERVANERDELKARAEAYVQRFLGQ